MTPTPAEAERLIAAHVPAAGIESVETIRAAGRILRAPVRADRDIPPFDRVMLDGYAVRRVSLAGAAGAGLRVEGFAAAGRPRVALSADPLACVEVATGAMLPEGADCVLPYELTSRLGDRVRASEEALGLGRGNAVHVRGSDGRAGADILGRGLRLGAAELAAAVSCGATSLEVSALPAIRILSSGDELVDPSATPEPWQLRRSNDVALGLGLAGAGFPGARSIKVKDTEASCVSALRRALASGAWVLTVGGVSRGRTDHMPAAFRRLGVLEYFRGVLQRPGKPFGFGVGPEGNPVFALPGNPASALVCLHRYVIPALLSAAGVETAPGLRLPLGEALERSVGLAQFIPATPEYPPDGLPRLRLRRLNNSGDYVGLTGSAGFVEIPPGERPLPAGAPVLFRPWC
jgi:molybdopterin molybdotransferase